MMRIITHTGIVDVTDDHSLILENGEEISPKSVEVGTKLLHSALPMPEEESQQQHSTMVTVEQARVMGASFVADEDENKMIPSVILNNTQEVRESFGMECSDITDIADITIKMDLWVVTIRYLRSKSTKKSNQCCLHMPFGSEYWMENVIEYAFR